MFVDSHCHIHFPGLAERLPEVFDNMQQHAVTHALCVSVELETLPSVLALAERYDNIYASVGVHPDYRNGREPALAQLVELAQHPKVVAIGETGLDYYRLTEEEQADLSSSPALAQQRERFRTHIRAARQTGKPLIIHTRGAANDTLKILQDEGAAQVGGVFHCFTESWDVAQAAFALNFYLSLSGIVTFKNARDLREVARRVPLERLLIETDSPYLAPTPHRGKLNQPAYVSYVGRFIAQLRELPEATLGAVTSRNFFDLFKIKAA